MRQTVISEFHKERPERREFVLLWNILLTALLYTAAVLALSVPGRNSGLSLFYWIIPAVLAIVCCLIADVFSKKKYLHFGILFLPWLLLVLVLNVGSILQGVCWWINCVLDRWNELHQGGISLLNVASTDQGILSITVFGSFAIAWIANRLVKRRHLLCAAVLAFLILLCQAVIWEASSWPCGLFLLGILGMWITQKNSVPQQQAIRIWGICAIFAAISFAIFPGKEITGVTEFRNAAKQEIHTIRYGEDLLPEGDLKKAAKLHSGEQEILTIQTEQQKNLYLRGFSGSEYQNGIWTPLPDSAYADVYTGLLSWLKKQNFDPLTQPATYYSLSDTAANASVQKNRIQVKVTGGSRYYLYTPSSLETISESSLKEDDDVRFLAPGIMGLSVYTMEEMSPAKPSELTVREDWISNPQTEEQRQYAEAEAYYRDFVYENYTSVDAELAALLEEMFWKDYEPETDSSYEAISRVREVLRENTEYNSQPDTEKKAKGDLLDAFLTGKQAGNAVMYASAAVEALRSHGIPARYVEGYYLSAAKIGENTEDKISVTGQNAHAWAEVYFDGIGWLPVDVTPGYYYDSLTLQQMIALPDAIQKTAIQDDSNPDGSQITDQSGNSGGQIRAEEIVKDIAKMILGILAVIVIAIVLLLLFLEIRRIIEKGREKRAFESASASQKIVLMKNLLFHLLSLWGMEAALGWNTEKTDQELAERFASVEAGEYMRTSELIEKSIYGEIELEAFEVRIIQNLIEKLEVPDRAAGKMYWKLRYRWAISK